MNVTTLPYSEDMHFADKDLAYIREHKGLMAYAKYRQTIDEFPKVISDKQNSYDPGNREVLAEVLERQYEHLPADKVATEQIRKLKDSRTFTVTTAHQPCLFTGPLYVLYKIISAVNLARKLNESYSEFHFVPVFVSGGEDHDLEEINHAHIYGNKVEWQPGLVGAVGRMAPSNIEEVLDQVENYAGKSKFADEAVNLLRNAFKDCLNYGHAFRKLIAEIFAESGLLVLNMDDRALKSVFAPIIEDDLLNHSSKRLVTSTQEELGNLGFDAQAYPRKINSFYHCATGRLRIEQSEDGQNFQLVDSDKVFSREEILKELAEQPENFSPNVVLRPLFQELLLPNLAYVGGGGEIAYWLERGSQFEHYGINFPMLVRRNSVFLLDHIACKNLRQLEMDYPEIFSDPEQLINTFVLDEAGEEISLEEEKRSLVAVFRDIESKAVQLERSILKTIKAEEVKHLKSIDHLEHKLLKAKKQQLDVKVNKIRKTHEKLFPNGKPQERFDNFLMYYFRLGPEFLSMLMKNLDPLEKEVVIFQEDD